MAKSRQTFVSEFTNKESPHRPSRLTEFAEQPANTQLKRLSEEIAKISDEVLHQEINTYTLRMTVDFNPEFMGSLQSTNRMRELRRKVDSLNVKCERETIYSITAKVS